MLIPLLWDAYACPDAHLHCKVRLELSHQCSPHLCNKIQGGGTHIFRGSGIQIGMHISKQCKRRNRANSAQAFFPDSEQIGELMWMSQCYHISKPLQHKFCLRHAKIFQRASVSLIVNIPAARTGHKWLLLIVPLCKKLAIFHVLWTIQNSICLK